MRLRLAAREAQNKEQVAREQQNIEQARTIDVAEIFATKADQQSAIGTLFDQGLELWPIPGQHKRGCES